MRFGRLHLGVGVIFLLVFAATGAFLKARVPPLKQADPFLRMLFRSRHVYLMFGASSNALLGSYWRELGGRARYWAAAGSSLILVSPLLALVGFVLDPAAGTIAAAMFGKFAAFSLFGGTALHLLAGALVAKSRRADG